MQFAGRDPEAREKTALRSIAISFFALAAYVTVESVRALLGGGDAGDSTTGLVLAAISLAVMPGLSWAQRRTGRELGSRTAVADSKQTLLCTTCQRSCSSASVSTACSAGAGPTRLPR
jgi:divalent metal cation (Fe/Co/Zn/Cd) transporter